MGIPTYFRFLLEKHRDIVIEKNTYDCDYFFLDFNSILYKVLYDNEKNKIYEDVFLRNIIRELKNICNNVFKPKKGLCLNRLNSISSCHLSAAPYL